MVAKRNPVSVAALAASYLLRCIVEPLPGLAKCGVCGKTARRVERRTFKRDPRDTSPVVDEADAAKKLVAVASCPTCRSFVMRKLTVGKLRHILEAAKAQRDVVSVGSASTHSASDVVTGDELEKAIHAEDVGPRFAA